MIRSWSDEIRNLARLTRPECDLIEKWLADAEQAEKSVRFEIKLQAKKLQMQAEFASPVTQTQAQEFEKFKKCAASTITRPNEI